MADQPVPSDTKKSVVPAGQPASPAAAPVAEPVVATHPEIQQLKDFFREYGQPALVGLGIALAIVLGLGAWRNYKQTSAERAAALLSSAASTEQLQQILAQHADSPSAPIAMLALSAQAFAGGQYELAQSTYTQFEQKYPRHPMKESAQLGKAQCLEAMKQYDQALEAFSAFITANSRHFLLPMAVLGKGRCLEQLGRLDEARTVYEDFIAANPDSNWSGHMRSAIQFVEKQKRAAKMSPSQISAMQTPMLEVQPAEVPVAAPAVAVSLPVENPVAAPAEAVSLPAEGVPPASPPATP